MVFLISAKAEETTQNLAQFSTDEKQVTESFCILGT